MQGTTDEIRTTLEQEDYDAELASAIREVAETLNHELRREELDMDTVNFYLIESLPEFSELYLTHPISIIEFADASVSMNGSERLGDVTSTEDFATEQARDIYRQDIQDAVESILDGETVAKVSYNTEPEKPLFDIDS